ncbi:hypothetical protein CRUP_014815 [Coryphaenoides rupestris]|nr:hypothetical protein CRUP_014815 [Coryphaenoides rupestris]
MKMRRHRVFLLCTVGLCVISFLHYYKALHYVSLLRELSAPYPNIKSFIMVTGFFWREQSMAATPLSPAPPEEAPPLRPHHRPPDAESMGDLHTRTYQLQDDRTSYFVRTKAGALCFRQGTEVTVQKEEPGNGKVPGGGPSGPGGQRRPLEVQQQQQSAVAGSASTSGGPLLRVRPRGARGGKRLVKCVCRPGWHGPYCGVPTMVYHSNLPTKERLTPRETPRRVINAINVNHDFLQRLLNGTYSYVRHKIVYVFLDHFPEGGRQDGWIADDYLRTYLTRNGMARVGGARPDDVFVINDADEIPAHEGLLFLKLFDGWTEPFAIHMRKSLYGFFWKQLGSLEVVSGCTVGMLRQVYDGDGIRLRRREYYTMPGFRRYENDTGHILVQWSVGSPFHFAGWHCSWCFSPLGIHLKLVSAQNGDFPRWGDYEDKRDLGYIRELIRTGGWFDGSLQEYPPTDPKEHMYAPKYMLAHYEQFGYLLDNPYARPDPAAAPGGRVPQSVISVRPPDVISGSWVGVQGMKAGLRQHGGVCGSTVSPLPANEM